MNTNNYTKMDMDLEQRKRNKENEMFQTDYEDESNVYKGAAAAANNHESREMMSRFATIKSSNKELRPKSINHENNELKRLTMADNYYNSSRSDVDLILASKLENQLQNSRDINDSKKLLKLAAEQADKTPIKTINNVYFDQKKNLFKTKRRNTISTIGLGKMINQQLPKQSLISSNLNIFRSSQTSLNKKPSIERMSINVADLSRRDSNSIDLKDEINQMDIFEIIQLENVDYLKRKISTDPRCVNEVNEVNFTPLDIVLMLNNSDLFQVLLHYGALEKTELLNWNVRYDRVCDKYNDLNANLTSLLEHFDVANLSLEEITEYNSKFKEIDLKIKLYKKMKLFLENCQYPSRVENVRLEVSSSNSLLVMFDEPNYTPSIIIKYLFEWSSNPFFESLEGRREMSFKDGSRKQCLIQNLTTSKVYYVRVTCSNIRGFGPYEASSPRFAIPSYWQDVDDRIQIKRQRQQEKLKNLNCLIQSSRFNLEFVNSDFLNTMQKFSKSKKSSGIRKNIKTLFTLALATSNFASLSQSHSNVNLSSSKFARLIKKNTAYLVSVVYENGRVLTTSDENLPIIEIEENYTMQNINNDFHFLIKLSYNWHEIDLFKTLIEQTISTTSLRFRYLILSAIKQMQNLLEINDLGRVYCKYLKNVSSGSTFFVLVKHKSNLKRLNFSQALKTQEVDSLLNKLSRVKARSANLNKEAAADYTDTEFNFLLRHLRAFIEFNSNSHNKLNRGLYVAYLKLQSNIEHVKVMVPYRIPNMLPCQKVRDNPNVSREEWNLLKSVKQDVNKLSINELNSVEFLSRVVDSIEELCRKLDIGDEESLSLRVILHYVIEINPNVTLLVVCPPLEQVCVMQLNDDAISIASSASSSSSPTTEFKDLQAASCPLLPTPTLSQSISYQFSHTFLPVQFFEAINFYTYDEEFIRAYVRISVLLEIESLASLQFSREAFSNDEINRSKRISNIVCNYVKQLEDIWKESRWILELINIARDKSPNPANIILHKELKNFLSVVSDENRRMVAALTNGNGIQCCSECAGRISSSDMLKRNAFKTCKNIYNNITMLSDSPDCVCHLHVSPIKYHHIDSVLIDDDDILLNGLTDNQTTTNSSIEEIRFLKPPVTSVARNRNAKQLVPNNSKDKNIQKLISKLYISNPNSTTTTTTNIDLSTTTINKENTIKIQISSAENNNNNEVNSNVVSVSRHKILVGIDFETCLKIDVLFECMILSNTTACELIYQIVKKLNSYIYCFNMINKSEDVNIFGSEWEQEQESDIINSTTSDNDNLRLKSNSPICLIEERPDLYYLVVTNFDGNQFEERVISDNLILSVNGDFANNVKYLLRKKEHFF